MKAIFFALLILVVPFNINAYEGTPEKQIDEFTKDLMTIGARSALDNLFSTNLLFDISKEHKQELQGIRRQIENYLAYYSEITDFEKIRIENYGKNIQHAVYVSNHALHPLVWEFYFYKYYDHKKDQRIWVPSAIRYNDQFHGLSNN